MSRGPFARGVLKEDNDGLAYVDVLDMYGEPFCRVYAYLCDGSDNKEAAVARVTRIAESLNQTEGHQQ